MACFGANRVKYEYFNIWYPVKELSKYEYLFNVIKNDSKLENVSLYILSKRGWQMLITRECDYAVRVIRAMAGEKRLSVHEICEKEDITVPFAYKILKKLQKAKIVKGFRGVNGGYTMNRKMGEITLYDVYHAIDPDMFIIECLDPNHVCSRNGADGISCRVHHELCGIQLEIEKMLKAKTLEDLMK